MTKIKNEDNCEINSAEVLRLINIPKYYKDRSVLYLSSKKFTCELSSENGREIFQLDYSRGGSKIKTLKYKVQGRSNTAFCLLRLDIGSTHQNPPNELILYDTNDPFYDIHPECIGRFYGKDEPHIHMYREGYMDSWAYPLPKEFSNYENTRETFKEFMEKFNIVEQPIILEGLKL